MHCTRFLNLLLALILVFACALPAAAAGEKVLMIVAPRDFEDVEYTKPRGEFDDAGFAVTVSSTKTGTLKGRKGKRVDSDVELKDVDVSGYDAVVVIGGNGIKKLWDDEAAQNVIRQASEQGKIVAAICAGPGLLAEAGVLQGKKATAHPKSGARSMMEDAGCSYTDDKVVVDGNLITANGPKAAGAFGEAVVEALTR